MTLVALALILAAAIIHASFNLLAKRAGAAILGKRLLAEGGGRYRLIGAAAMTIGLICLALGVAAGTSSSLTPGCMKISLTGRRPFRIFCPRDGNLASIRRCCR